MNIIYIFLCEKKINNLTEFVTDGGGSGGCAESDGGGNGGGGIAIVLIKGTGG